MRIEEEGRRWWVLVGACLGLFILMLDSTVINLALPAMQAELDSSTAALQWIPNAYLLTIAALVVTGGRLGDIFGRRRLFDIGLALFAAGSVVAALAPSIEVLIAGRVLQGVGAAALLPLSLALVSDAFPESEQARAMGIWAAVSSIALAVGPLLGGLVVELDWRLLFWVNLPLAAAGIAIVRAAARESRDEESAQRVDWPGLVLLTVGLVCLVLPLVEAQQWGWGSTRTIALLAASVVLLTAFARTERRVSYPIVDFRLFRNGPYFGASAAAFSLVGAYWSVMYFESQYLQNILGYPPSTAGLLILPITVPMVFVSPLAARLIARFGTRRLMTFGMACGTAGVFLITRTSADTGYGLLLPAFLLFGLALGFVYAPMSAAAMAAMPRSKAGIASGVLAMNRVAAGAIALAATGALFAAIQTNQIDELVSGPGGIVPATDARELDGLVAGSESAREEAAKAPPAQRTELDDAARRAYSDAIAGAFWILVGLTAAGTVLTWIFVRDPRPPTGTATAAVGGPRELRHHQHHRRFHL
jgi:EmrB/QacA subfamily drug resistance transporter